MYSSKKVWVIDADHTSRRKRPTAATPRAQTPSSPATSSARSNSQPHGEATLDRNNAANRSGLIASSAYLLGSISPVILRQGNRSLLWAALGIGATLAWAFTLGQWQQIQSWLASGRLPFHVWLAAICTITLVGITTWSRAILLAGRDRGFFPERRPGWLRQPGIVGFLGFVVPGLGLLTTGHPMRAALALWNFGLMSLAALGLWNAGWLWNTHQLSPAAGFDSLTLEKIFVAGSIIALVGCLGWIVSAYEGARLANRSPVRASMQGSWWAVAILSLGVAFLISFDPAARAGDLNRVASSMHEEGYRFIPLHVELAALRLDPSNLAYHMQAAELYDELGKEDVAAAIREDVQLRWQDYSNLMQEMTPTYTDLQLSKLRAVEPWAAEEIGFLLPPR